MLRAQTGRSARFAVSDELPPFLAGASWSEPDLLTAAAELEESWFLGLRRSAGVSIPALAVEFGSEAVHASLIAARELVSSGLLYQLDPDTLALTARGRLLSNEVFGALLEA